MRPPMDFYPWLLRSGRKVRTLRLPPHFRSDQQFVRHVDGYFKRLSQRSLPGAYSRQSVQRAVTLELEDLEDRLDETRALLGHLEDRRHLSQLTKGRNPSTLFADRHVAPIRREPVVRTLLHGSHEVALGTYLFSHVVPFGMGIMGGLGYFGVNHLMRRQRELLDYHERLRKFLREKDLQRHVNVRAYLDGALVHAAAEGQVLAEPKPRANYETLMAFKRALERTERLGEAYYAGLLALRDGQDRAAALGVVQGRLMSPEPRPARMDEQLAARQAELARLREDVEARWAAENAPAVRKSIQRQARKRPKKDA